MVIKIFRRVFGICRYPEQDEFRGICSQRVLSYTDEETGSEIILMPVKVPNCNHGDFGTKVLGTQNVTLNI